MEKVLAVDGVDLQLHWGEIFGLVGPNGAGKTTLIKMLTTLLTPNEGTAQVAGFDIFQDNPQIRQIVGLVTSNERSFYWRLTGRQNLVFFADLYHIPPAEAHAWMEEMFDLLGLQEIIDKRFDAYSTGQRQRLAMARGLLSKPKVLFMDEPTKGVDPIGASEIVQIIRECVVGLWNPTILVTSHNLQEIERLCGRIAFMDHGRIVALGTLHELRRLAARSETYRLTISRLSQQQIQEVVGDVQTCQMTPAAHDKGLTELEVSFLRDSGGFARMIRSIIDHGGDVETCTATEASIDDVFHAVISKTDRTPMGAPKE